MRLLLDTHIVLWSLHEPARLGESRTLQVQDRSNTVFVSSVSVAEIAIKCSLGKLQVKGDLIRAIQDAGFEWLDFTAAEAMLLKQMPYHHKDPFDRMLVAQCLSLDLPLMSDDTRLGAYGCRLV